jgi:hypothetical protein
LTPGVNTVVLNFAATATPDLNALAATASPGLTVHISNGVGAFALATINAGATGPIYPEVDTGTAALPVVLNICQTDSTGQCLTDVSTSVVQAGATATYSVFVSDSGTPIPFDPANSRIFVRFYGGGSSYYGSTSVAVTTD